PPPTAAQPQVSAQAAPSQTPVTPPSQPAPQAPPSQPEPARPPQPPAEEKQASEPAEQAPTEAGKAPPKRTGQRQSRGSAGRGAAEAEAPDENESLELVLPEIPALEEELEG